MATALKPCLIHNLNNWSVSMSNGKEKHKCLYRLGNELSVLLVLTFSRKFQTDVYIDSNQLQIYQNPFI